MMAVNLGREILFYTCKGRYIKNMVSKIEAEKVEFIDKNTVAILTKNSLVITKIGDT